MRWWFLWPCTQPMARPYIIDRHTHACMHTHILCQCKIYRYRQCNTCMNIKFTLNFVYFACWLELSWWISCPTNCLYYGRREISSLQFQYCSLQEVHIIQPSPMTTLRASCWLQAWGDSEVATTQPCISHFYYNDLRFRQINRHVKYQSTKNNL